MPQNKNLISTPNAKILKREVKFDGYHTLEIVELQPKSLRDGGWAPPQEREMFTCGSYSMMIMYVPETDMILLNEQFRVGAFMADADDPFLFECAAGVIDENETPEQAAIREAFEETGAQVQEIEFVGSYFTSPGCLDELAYIFVGRIPEDTLAGNVLGVEDEGEEIKSHLLPAEKVFEMLDKGHIRNGSSALALHWFVRNKDRIRKKWLGK